MKNLKIFAAALILGACSPKSGEIQVPAAVKEAFTTKNPAASEIKWSKEGDNEFEAEFSVNGVAHSSKFDSAGKWLETESVVEKDKLPEAVRTFLGTEFPGASVLEAEWAETPDKGSFYEILLKSGESTMEVQISEAGALISKKEKGEKEDEEEDDDDDEEGK